MSEAFYQRVEQQVIQWARTRPEIRAVLVAGSRARVDDHPGDQWAGLDIEMFVSDTQPLLNDTGWPHQFGDLWMYLPYETGDGQPQILSLYEGGCEIDFTFFSLAELIHHVQTQTLDASQRRGYRVLVDKDGLAAQLPAPKYVSAPLPTAAEYAFEINAFWYSIVVLAKQIRRRNLMGVKLGDGHIKRHTLTMLEWHTQFVRELPIWHSGHFIAEWIDSQTYQQLAESFAHFDAADSWRALLASMNLFRHPAQETARQLGYDYPQALDDHVTAYVERLHAEDLV
jgi:aminoglycoside 6-adenylyltransferase